MQAFVAELEHGRPSFRRVRAPEGLSVIFDRQTNTCIWERPVPPRIARALPSVFDALPEFEVEARLGRGSIDVTPLLQPVSDRALREALSLDIAKLSARLLDLTGAAVLLACLKLTATDGCRKLHVDNRGVRLLTTYRGPGTEWVPNRYVDRDALASLDVDFPRINARIVPEAQTIRSVRAGHVVLLKGEAPPGRPGFGAVHRSPAIEGTGVRRLLLRLDHVG